MRYDQPPYPCPGCGRPRLISTPEECGSGAPVAQCLTCPAQDAKGNPVGVLVLSWAEVVREVLRRAGQTVGEHLDSLAGLVPRESRESIGVQIQECWQEQTRRRGGSGGSNSKGRKKDPKGGGKWLGTNDDQRTGDESDLARTTRRKPKSRLTSSVHSTRLEGDRRRKLKSLSQKRGISESEVLGQGVDVLHAIDWAREGGRDASVLSVLSSTADDPPLELKPWACEHTLAIPVGGSELASACPECGAPLGRIRLPVPLGEAAIEVAHAVEQARPVDKS